MNRHLHVTAARKRTTGQLGEPLRALALAASLVACGGMGGAQSGARLEPASVTALKLVAVGGKTTFCPSGSPVQLKAIASLEGGDSLATWSDGESREGRLDFAAFEWTASHGQVDGEGRVRLAADPFPLLERPLLVTAKVAGKPAVEARLELTPNWRCGGRIELSGAAGSDGKPGAAGVEGRRGRIGDAVIGATNGELGEPGEPGGEGGAGRPPSAVDVALGWVTAPKVGRLVLARVNGRAYLFDPAGEKLEVVADGGPGGKGAPGGRGGSGGKGGASTTAGRGPDGRSGRPGTNGVMGQAGRPGPALQPQPADARALFADEIGRGVPVGVE